MTAAELSRIKASATDEAPLGVLQMFLGAVLFFEGHIDLDLIPSTLAQLWLNLVGDDNSGRGKGSVAVYLIRGWTKIIFFGV